MPKYRLERTIDTSNKIIRGTSCFGMTVNGGGTAPPGDGSGMVVHSLNGGWHTGTLDPDQAPWAVTSTIFTAHATDANAHHSQLHNLLDTNHHQIIGNRFDVIGLTSDNVLGLRVPSNRLDLGNKLAQSDENGDITVNKLTLVSDLDLAGNILMQAGKTVDGVDVSTFRTDFDTHAADPAAHHNPVTAGTNIFVDGNQQVSLATNVWVAGTLDASGPTDLHSTLNVDGNATLGANLTVTGDTVLNGDLTFAGALNLPHWTFDENTGAMTSTDPLYLPHKNQGIQITPSGWITADVIKVRGEIFAAVLGYKETVVHSNADLWTYGGGCMLAEDIVISGPTVTIRVDDTPFGEEKRILRDDILFVNGMASNSYTLYPGESLTPEYEVARFELLTEETYRFTSSVWLRAGEPTRGDGYWEYNCDVLKSDANNITIKAGSGIANYGKTELQSRDYGYIHVTAGDTNSPRFEIGKVGAEPWNGEIYPTMVSGNLSGYVKINATEDYGTVIADNVEDPKAWLLAQPTGIEMMGGSVRVKAADGDLAAEMDSTSGMNVYIGTEDINAYQVRSGNTDELFGELSVGDLMSFGDEDLPGLYTQNIPTVLLSSKWHRGGETLLGRNPFDLANVPEPVTTIAGSRILIGCEGWQLLEDTVGQQFEYKYLGSHIELRERQGASPSGSTGAAIMQSGFIRLVAPEMEFGPYASGARLAMDEIGFLLKGLATSATNLPSGYLYNDNGTLKIKA